MIHELKPYPTMKDSGVPWLGEVPEHWKVRKLRSILAQVTKRNQPNMPLLSVLRERGVIKRDITSKDENHNFIPDDLSNYKVVQSGQFVMNKMKAWQGSYGVSQYSGIVSPAYYVFDLSEVGGEFFHLAIRSGTCVPFFAQASDGVRIGQWDLSQARMKEIPFLVPTIPEQDAIVRFLNRVDYRTRRYIRAKQKQIKLLEEQKQAIIHRAVTRGLDPNVRLKPSVVEWLGEIPLHWDMIQLRRLVSLVTSGSRGWASYYSEMGNIFLQSGNLGRSMSLNLSFIQHVQPPPGSEGERTKVRYDDVLICITGALTGNVAHVDMDLSAPAFVNQHVALIRPYQAMIYPRYLAFTLHSEVGRIQFKTGEYGGTKQGLGLDEVKSALVPLPPISEQIAICSDLDTKIAGLMMAINNIGAEINLLREYRTRLISDVVTGKLDVRGIELPAIDDAEMPIELNSLLSDELDQEDQEIQDEVPAEGD